MFFKKRIEGCCEYWFEWYYGNIKYAIGKYNPGMSGSWFFERNNIHWPIRKNIFWWSHELQAWLYKRGIYWPNWIIDECTPGFECCMNKVSEDGKQSLRDLRRAVEEQMPLCVFRKDKTDGKNK